MFALQKYQNKKIAIYGMGLTGFSAAKKFRKLKAKVFCWDDSKKIRKKITNLKFESSKSNDRVKNDSSCCPSNG